MRYDSRIVIEEREDVYSPGEDSLLLIESLNISECEKVLEMGCGSGIVAIHCAKNGASVTAVDINPSAVSLTRKNASANGTYMDIRLSDLYEDIDSYYDT
ncbi:MAG: methyltransferase, partial [Methanomassiliicoccaceae archaeon]|nr:methyltransferase [Methanomassiliicoccaceae archaeon]